VTTLRRILRLVMPLAFIIMLWFTFSDMRSVFIETTVGIRHTLGRLSTKLGVVPTDGVAIGMYKPEVPFSMGSLQTIEEVMGRPLDIVSFYTTWGDRDADRFPAALLAQIDDHGAIAMVTWEPWVTEFVDVVDRIAAGTRTNMNDIAAGRYDAYLRRWAQDAAVYGQVFFLRFAHEMDHNQYPWSAGAGNSAEDFVAAWRHVHDIFHEEGARNVVWVWSPHEQTDPAFYPGNAYVDWIGLSVFNYGTTAGSKWHPFSYLYQPIYRSALQYHKPIMIAELGSTSVGGNRSDWYHEAMQAVMEQFPETRAVLVYNNPADRTSPGEVIDWSIDHDRRALQALGNLGTTNEQ